MASSFFSIRLLSVHVVHPYSSIDKTAAWKKMRYIYIYIYINPCWLFDAKSYLHTQTHTYILNISTIVGYLILNPVYTYIYIYIYIYNQIDKIKDSVEDRQSRIAWQTINEVSGRKSTAKAKLKDANQQERIKLWKQHFENLQGNPPKVTHELITGIISTQLDIKLGPFTQEELDSVLRKIKNRKAAGLDEIPQKYGRPKNSTIYCSDTATQSIIKIRYTHGWRDASSPSLKRVTSD